MDLCRLCSAKEHIVNVFQLQVDHGQQLRLSIFLATGIQIKETDIVSKMVCRRCCEITVKLHKYRRNAVANDNLLKNQLSQPYIPPTVVQEDLRAAQSITPEGKNTCSDLSGINGTNTLSKSLDLAIKREQIFTSEIPLTNIINNPLDTNRNGIVRYKHPSVVQLIKQYNNIRLPRNVIKSHILPVITLDHTEVSDWYEDQVKMYKQKLKNIAIQKVPTASENATVHSENVIVSLKSSTTPENIKSQNTSVKIQEDGQLTSVNRRVEQVVVEIRKKVKSKPTTRRMVISSDDVDNDDDYHQTLISDCETENCKFDHLNENESLLTQKEVKTLGPRRTSASHKRVIEESSDSKNVFTKKKKIFAAQNECHIAKKAPNMEVAELNQAPISSVELYLEKPQTMTHVKDLTFVSENVNSGAQLLKTSELPELIKSKTRQIIVCPICSNISDTKREHMKHRRIHLTCKFCRVKVTSLKALNIHQKDTCLINVKNMPIIKLTRVDEIPYIIEQYPKTFNADVKPTCSTVETTATEISFQSHVDYTDFGVHFEENPSILPTSSIPLPNVKACDTKSHTVYNSDIDDNIVPQHKIIDNPYFTTNEQVDLPMVNSSHKLLALACNGISSGRTINKQLSEMEMVRFLFRKHSNILAKCCNSSQTIQIPVGEIKYTTSNQIILEDMFLELFLYRIPVKLVSQTTISAKYVETENFTQQRTIQCWANIEQISLSKRNAFSLCSKVTNGNTSATPVGPKAVTQFNYNSKQPVAALKGVSASVEQNKTVVPVTNIPPNTKPIIVSTTTITPTGGNIKFTTSNRFVTTVITPANMLTCSGAGATESTPRNRQHSNYLSPYLNLPPQHRYSEPIVEAKQTTNGISNKFSSATLRVKDMWELNNKLHKK